MWRWSQRSGSRIRESPRSEPDAAVVNLDRAAYQVLSLIAPFLQGRRVRLLDRLSQDYL